MKRRTFIKTTGAMMLASPFSISIGSEKKLTDVRIRDLAFETENFEFRVPLKFGSSVVRMLTIIHVTAVLESRSGKQGTGFGSMPVGNAWAWPSQKCTPSKTHQIMVEFGKRLVDQSRSCSEYGHPLELTRILADNQIPLAKDLVKKYQISESIPRLAQLNMGSPLEAALFDAYGKLHHRNIFSLLGPEHVNTDLSEYLNSDFSGEYLDQYTTRKPRDRLPLYHLVGGLDPLSDSDLVHPVKDGLPETLRAWIQKEGLTHLKIKLMGHDLQKDIDRMVAVEKVVSEVQKERGIDRWHYSVDFNEKCPSEDYVLDWLNKIGEKSPNARRSLMYIEQPTQRDLDALPKIKMKRAAKLCPIVIDESLTGFEELQKSRELGYSGVALKACKGFAEALLMGAAAQKYKLFLCVQDLTCPGDSFLQSAAIAAHLPSVSAIEGNARQFCPKGNELWAKRFPGMFSITDGTVSTALLSGFGIGY